MLVEFRTKGFKNFKEEVCLDLGDVKNYEFSSGAIKNDTVKTALIYGANGSGKTNLGYALFDIVIHLTDNYFNMANYTNYLNLDQGTNAFFYYKFVFNNSVLEYSYIKKDAETLTDENVKINGNDVISYNRKAQAALVNLEGAESLNTDLSDTNISFVKYVSKNTVLGETKKNKVFRMFIDFVNGMLLFSSLERNLYQGFKTGSDIIGENIISHGKLTEFQDFLNKNSIKYTLVAKKETDGQKIYCKFNKRSVNFFSIASKGTTSLTLFFNWMIQFGKVSLVFIDEFDAFYHSDVAKYVVETIRDNNDIQGILTTHNTDIMTNDLLRPDCYFRIAGGRLVSFSDSTQKELRKAHNLQKMYKAGAFTSND